METDFLHKKHYVFQLEIHFATLQTKERKKFYSGKVLTSYFLSYIYLSESTNRIEKKKCLMAKKLTPIKCSNSPSHSFNSLSGSSVKLISLGFCWWRCGDVIVAVTDDIFQRNSLCAVKTKLRYSIVDKLHFLFNSIN